MSSSRYCSLKHMERITNLHETTKTKKMRFVVMLFIWKRTLQHSLLVAKELRYKFVLAGVSSGIIQFTKTCVLRLYSDRLPRSFEILESLFVIKL